MFQFRQFLIRQDRCAMKVGTDGVLLGAWAKGGKSILDIGTGTGLIALMMAQRFPCAHVDAVEIDADAASQALENVEASPFASRIDVFQTSVQTYSPSLLYDSIVSNPPYFAHALKNPDAQRAMARHTDSLTFRELIHAVVRLLSEDGEFSVVVPFNMKTLMTDEASIQGLFLVRQYAVKTVNHKSPKRYLLAFSKKRSDFFDEKEVSMMNADERSAWYDELTKAFYLP